MQGEGSQSHIDVAALASGAVAVSVALFVSPGDFQLINLITSVVLLSVILTYTWMSKRNGLQSLAFAAMVSFVLIPGFGFVDEACRSCDPASMFTGTYDWVCGQDPCKEKTDEHESRVKQRDIALFWLIAALVILAADLSVQSKRSLATA